MLTSFLSPDEVYGIEWPDLENHLVVLYSFTLDFRELQCDENWSGCMSSDWAIVLHRTLIADLVSSTELGILCALVEV
jgi:hypothetical protein